MQPLCHVLRSIPQWPALLPADFTCILRFPHRSLVQVVRIPTNPSDAQLRELLAPYKDMQLLHFSSLDKAFGKWESEADGDKFQASPQNEQRQWRWWSAYACDRAAASWQWQRWCSLKLTSCKAGLLVAVGFL
jgi:hypothetical protein